MIPYECYVSWTEKDGSGRGAYTTVYEANSREEAMNYFMDEIADIRAMFTKIHISVKRMAYN